MIITIGYVLVGGGVLYIIESLIMKKKQIDLSRLHSIFGFINFGLACLFLVLYFINPSLFSTNTGIENQFLYICFSVLASYYYILAAPISLANSILLGKMKNKGLLFYLNLLATVLLIVSFPLFLK